MIVVSDTSPIINLAAIGQLDLLRKLYGNVIIPQAVYHEIVVLGAGEPGADDVQQSSWISVRTAKDRTLVDALLLSLDAGEAEAIACALEHKADLILMDERRGRLAVERLNLTCLGLLGILIEAKRRGMIAAVQPLLDDLIAKAGFWVAPPLYRRILDAAGEPASRLRTDGNAK
jgi:hypothetical protein